MTEERNKGKQDNDTTCKSNDRVNTLTLPVKVVNGVAPVVFNVPAEGWEAHAHIQPGQLHSADVGCNVSEHGAVPDGHVVQVPAAVQVVLQVGDTHTHTHTLWNHSSLTWAKYIFWQFSGMIIATLQRSDAMKTWNLNVNVSEQFHWFASRLTSQSQALRVYAVMVAEQQRFYYFGGWIRISFIGQVCAAKRGTCFSLVLLLRLKQTNEKKNRLKR